MVLPGETPRWVWSDERGSEHAGKHLRLGSVLCLCAQSGLCLGSPGEAPVTGGAFDPRNGNLISKMCVLFLMCGNAAWVDPNVSFGLCVYSALLKARSLDMI